MSEPTTFEFAVIYVGNGATPEVKVKLCGIQTTGFNRTVQSNDRFVRDCDNPARVPERRVRVTGKQRDLTGSGLYNIDQTALLSNIEGKRRNFDYVLMDISDESVPAGVEIGTWSGPGVVTTLNMGTNEDDDATVEITIASDGLWTYTAAA